MIIHLPCFSLYLCHYGVCDIIFNIYIICFIVIEYKFRYRFLLATLFLELWKRYSAEITHRWDLTGLDAQEEHPRPQYLARLAHIKKKSLNTITNTEEPKVPFWKMKVPATILSFSVVLLLVCVHLK